MRGLFNGLSKRKERILRLGSKRFNGKSASLLLSAALLVPLTGCAGDNDPNGFLDPTAVGRYKKAPLVVRVLDKLDVGIEEPSEEFTNAEEVKPNDLIPAQGDYRIGKNDLISVSISDLTNQGVETVKTARVTDSGNIS